MDQRRFQSRGYRLAAHRFAPVGACRESSRLHGLPYGEQLQPHRSEHGLLWVPPDRMAEPDQDALAPTEPRYCGLSDHGLLRVPSDLLHECTNVWCDRAESHHRVVSDSLRFLPHYLCDHGLDVRGFQPYLFPDSALRIV